MSLTMQWVVDMAEPSLTVTELPIPVPDASISGLDARVDAAEADITSIEADITTINASLSSINTSITSLLAADVALALRASNLESYNLKIIDFAQYGTPDDPDFDNTPALQLALAAAYAAGGAIIWFGGGKEWWFLTALDSNNPLTYAHYDNIYFLGIAPENTKQHQEAADGGVLDPDSLVDLENTYNCRLRFNLPAGSTWCSIQRTYRFGSIRAHNLSWRTETRHWIFDLGQEGEVLGGSYRGLHFSGCYFSCSPFTFGITNDWLVDSGVDGYTLPSDRVCAIKSNRGYDMVFRDCTFRNWPMAGVENIRGDRTLFDNCSTILCQLAVDTADGAVHGVSTFSNCCIESSPYYGLVTEGGMISNLSTEKGYSSVFTPDLGNYALPDHITWTISPGADEIIFSNFGVGWDATDYFFPNMIIEIEATEDVGTFLPPRPFYITEVTADRITFSNSTSFSYVGTALSGNGSQLTRLFHCNALLVDDGLSLSGFSFEINEAGDGGFEYAYVPGKKRVEFSGHAKGYGTGEAADPTSYQPRIIASSAGTQGVWGGLCLNSKHNAPDHPMVYFDGGPKPASNWIEPLWFEDSETQVFIPGRGIGTHSNHSRDLLFRQIEDESLGLNGELVWVYSLSDNASGWRLRPIRKPATSLTYWARVYAAQATSVTFYGGKGSANSHTLSIGWHTITGTSHVTNTVLDGATQMLADSHSAFVQLGGFGGSLGVYVAKVRINQ